MNKITDWFGSTGLTMGIAADHGGFELKAKLIPFLEGKGFTVKDFGPTFPIRIHAFYEDLSNNVPLEHLRASGRDALATMEYIFAAIDSYESGGQIVRPHALPAYHGDPTIIH